MMKYALEVWSDWRFYISFPITTLLVKPIDELATYLTERDTSFVHYSTDNEKWWPDAFDHCYVECSGTAFYFSHKDCQVVRHLVRPKQFFFRRKFFSVCVALPRVLIIFAVSILHF
jgi:hypothetical protein